MHIDEASSGCDYQGHEFGAVYLDSVCIDGRLYDADNCDDEGRLYEPLDYIACPMCKHSEWLSRFREDIINDAWGDHEKGKKRTDNPFTANSELRFPEDRWIMAAWWLQGWDEAKAKEAQ